MNSAERYVDMTLNEDLFKQFVEEKLEAMAFFGVNEHVDIIFNQPLKVTVRIYKGDKEVYTTIDHGEDTFKKLC